MKRNDKNYRLAVNIGDAELRKVVELANQYRLQHPDLSWSECIRLAEKHIKGE